MLTNAPADARQTTNVKAEAAQTVKQPQQPKKQHSFYFIDFVKSLRAANVPQIIYLCLNVAIISGIVYFGGGEELVERYGNIGYLYSFLIALGLYLISLMIALSPFGEWVLRKQTGCRAIKREDQKAFLMPLFNEVYSRAKAVDPGLRDDIQLFINDDEEPNAFATGRKTVCITWGLLAVPPEEIKATLGHEFGHLSHKDTDMLLVITVGNMIITAVITILRLIIDIFHVIALIGFAIHGGSEGLLGMLFETIYHALFTLIIVGLMKLWTWIGTMLVMKSSRANEYEADNFSVKLGYGYPLCHLLERIAGGPGPKGLFATLAASHPATDDRIANIQKQGVAYHSGMAVNQAPAYHFADQPAPQTASAYGSTMGGGSAPAKSGDSHKGVIIAVAIIAVAAVLVVYFMTTRANQASTVSQSGGNSSAATQQDQSTTRGSINMEKDDHHDDADDDDDTYHGSDEFNAAALDSSTGYLMPDSSSEYLTRSEVSGLTSRELSLARNEIFARHHRLFSSPTLQNYFNGKSWYNGYISPDDFDDSTLNSYERANVDLLKDVESSKGWYIAP